MTEREYLIQIIVEHYLEGKISRSRAALSLNCSERTVTRYADKIKAKSKIAGNTHQNHSPSGDSIFVDSETNF